MFEGLRRCNWVIPCTPQHIHPNNRTDVDKSFAVAVAHACGNFYASVAKDYPRELFGPVVSRAKRQLPGFLRFGWFDKGTDVPNFACVNAWRITHRQVFFESPRYKVICDLSWRHDTAFLLSWRLAESALW